MTFRHPLDVWNRVAEHVESVGRSVLDAALDVHTELGPGLTERVYTECLSEVLRDAGHAVASEVRVPIHFRGRRLDTGIRLDLLVDGVGLVEVKSVEALHHVHFAQTLTYLRFSGLTLGFLLNFNVAGLTSGMKRFVNTRPVPWGRMDPPSSTSAE